MKKILMLMIFVFTVLVGVGAQDSTGVSSDTLLNVENVITQIQNTAAAASGQGTTWLVMFLAAILGTIVRIVYSTYHGVINPGNNTPAQFIFSYWVKDNVLPKITVFLTYLVSFDFLISKLPTGITSYIVLGVISFIGGLFIDWIVDILRSVSPKRA